VRVLFDTHAFAWWVAGHSLLSAKACEVLEAPGTELLLSAVVPWEIAIKLKSGKWPDGERFLADIDAAIAADRLEPLSITHAHGVRAGLLAANHRDPFDRMLAAQAQLEGAAIATADPAFRSMNVEIIW
jgi:PIN domain nuclease of toxin-antitoxin system